MNSPKKHLSKSLREQEIINAADYILTTVGVRDFTVDKVIGHLGVAKGTIYKYYKSKDDVLAEVSVKGLTILLNHFKESVQKEKDQMDGLNSLVMAFYKYYLKYPKYFELFTHMERPEFQSEMRNYLKISLEIKNYFTDYLIQCQSAGLIKKDLDPSYCTYMIWGSCMGLMNFVDAKKVFIKEIVKLGQEDLLKLYAEILIGGLKV
ncbi:TetR/AcrR family transcriptional regulator [Pedobacter psychrotolerans]|nr:TetR/AcrR family transcriptional regulator [Pedobacter psychrotolerans]